MTILSIEIDTNESMIRLFAKKLNKTRYETSKALLSNSISLDAMQSLIDFLFFCSQTVRMGRVFMRFF